MTIGVDTGSRITGVAIASRQKVVVTRRFNGYGKTWQDKVARIISELIPWCKEQETIHGACQVIVLEELSIFGVGTKSDQDVMRGTRERIRCALMNAFPEANTIDQPKGKISKQQAQATARGLGFRNISQDEADAIMVLALAGAIR